MDVAGSLPRGMGVDDGRRAMVGYAPGASEEKSPLRVLIRTRAARPPPSLPHAYIDMYVRYTSCAPPSLLLILSRAVSCHIPGALPMLLSSRAAGPSRTTDRMSQRRNQFTQTSGTRRERAGREACARGTKEITGTDRLIKRGRGLVRLRGGLTRAEVTVITERRVHKRGHRGQRQRTFSWKSEGLDTLRVGRGSGRGRKESLSVGVARPPPILGDPQAQRNWKLRVGD